MHNPRVVNERVLNKFIDKYNLDTANNFALNTGAYLLMNEKINYTYPEVMFFNANGNVIPYKKQNECSANAFVFIDSLSANKTYIEDTTFGFYEINKNSFIDFKGNAKNLLHIDNYDFVMLIFWTEWTGKLNSNHTKRWEYKAKNNKNAKILVAKINCDFQESWPKEERNAIMKKVEERYKKN